MILSIPNFDDIGSLSVENWNDTPKCKYYLLPFISEDLFHFRNKAGLLSMKYAKTLFCKWRKLRFHTLFWKWKRHLKHSFCQLSFVSEQFQLLIYMYLVLLKIKIWFAQKQRSIIIISKTYLVLVQYLSIRCSKLFLIIQNHL